MSRVARSLGTTAISWARRRRTAAAPVPRGTSGAAAGAVRWTAHRHLASVSDCSTNPVFTTDTPRRMLRDRRKYQDAPRPATGPVAPTPRRCRCRAPPPVTSSDVNVVTRSRRRPARSMTSTSQVARFPVRDATRNDPCSTSTRLSRSECAGSVTVTGPSARPRAASGRPRSSRRSPRSRRRASSVRSAILSLTSCASLGRRSRSAVVDQFASCCPS